MKTRGESAMEETFAVQIRNTLEALRREIDNLEQAAREVPAIAGNVVRLRGTLRALEIQCSILGGDSQCR